jgi:hypothetical protein
MFLVSNFIKNPEITIEGRNFVTRSFIVMLIINFTIMLSNTVYILLSLDFVSISELSFLLCFLFTITLTDYPTSFITRLNQKQILILASFLYLFSFYFFTVASNFISFIPAYFFMGLAQGQESDAFRRYFEDNYHFYIPKDTNKILYDSFTNHMNSFIHFSTIISFIIGGAIASIFSRQHVFITQILLLLVVIIVSYFLLQEYPNKIDSSSNKKIISTFKENVSYCWSNVSLRYFIIGSAISGSTLTIFGTLIIFPLYFSYTTDDLYLGLLRSLILIVNGFFMISFKILLNKFIKNRFWLITITFLGSFTIFIGILFFVEIFSPSSVLNISVFALLLFIMSLSMLPQSFFKESKNDYLLSTIPEKRKENIFNFIPTIFVLFNIPLILLGGYMLTNYDLQTNLIILIVISIFGSFITAWGFYLYQFRLPRKELIKRTLNVYFGGQFEINAFTTIQLPVKYIWQRFTFSATKLWEDIVAEAVKDGSLTKDERTLIEKIMLQVRTYGLALEEVIEDAIISLDEEKRLQFIREQLFNVVFAEAKKDGIITEEELKILNLFKKHLENFKGFSSRTN